MAVWSNELLKFYFKSSSGGTRCQAVHLVWPAHNTSDVAVHFDNAWALSDATLNATGGD
jgi:hypothetical protein